MGFEGWVLWRRDGELSSSELDGDICNGDVEVCSDAVGSNRCELTRSDADIGLVGRCDLGRSGDLGLDGRYALGRRELG